MAVTATVAPRFSLCGLRPAFRSDADARPNRGSIGVEPQLVDVGLCLMKRTALRLVIGNQRATASNARVNTEDG